MTALELTTLLWSVPDDMPAMMIRAKVCARPDPVQIDLFDQPCARGPGERQMDIEDLIAEGRA